MAEERKPVALWKGIVGTAITSVNILGFTPLLIIVLFMPKDGIFWTYFSIISFVLLISLIYFPINLINLIQTAKYKREQRALEAEKEKEPVEEVKPDDTELLHRLLKEGHITIEEYDRLRSKK